MYNLMQSFGAGMTCRRLREIIFNSMSNRAAMSQSLLAQSAVSVDTSDDFRFTGLGVSITVPLSR